jgi:hypothetical protein
MNSILATTLIAATLAATPVRDVDVAQVYEDVRVIRRVASVSGQDLPRGILHQLIDESVERLRGKADERNYAYATWTRLESSRVSASRTVKKEKDGVSTIVELTAPSAYRLEITVPSRRYVAARNRPLQLDSVITEYTNAAGRRTIEQFALARPISPGESTSVDLPEIGWNVTARLKARAEEEAGGHGTVELALIAPTLVDEPASPYAAPTANLLAMKAAVRSTDILEIRRLCDATTSFFDDTSRQARSRVRPVGGVSPAGTLQGSQLLSDLQRIEDLLTGDEQQRREGMDKLHQLIIYLRP